MSPFHKQSDQDPSVASSIIAKTSSTSWPAVRLADRAQQLGLEDELALLVLLAALVGLVVLPAHRLLALAAGDVAHDVAARGHVALAGLAHVDVDHRVEKEGFAVLAAEVLESCVLAVVGGGVEGTS